MRQRSGIRAATQKRFIYIPGARPCAPESASWRVGKIEQTERFHTVRSGGGLFPTAVHVIIPVVVSCLSAACKLVVSGRYHLWYWRGDRLCSRLGGSFARRSGRKIRAYETSPDRRAVDIRRHHSCRSRA